MRPHFKPLLSSFSASGSKSRAPRAAGAALKVCCVLTALMLFAGVFSGCVGQTGPEPTQEPAASGDPNQTQGDKYTDAPDLFPTPKSVEYDAEQKSVAAGALKLESGNIDAEIERAFVRYGFKLAAGDESGLRTQLETDPALPAEGYRIEVREDGVKLTAADTSGMIWAINTLSQLCRNGRLPVVTVNDSPDTSYRGVIEGFYGTAWSHEFRLELMEFMGENKLNTYIYAPKDDPKHRSQWRSAYTKAELERLGELVTAAADNNVDFVYAISPGLDIKLGTGYDTDFEKLVKKCDSVYELGVRSFAILLDDIPTKDAEGHAKLLNDFQTEYVEKRSGVHDLIIITPEFCEAMVTAYTNELAPLLSKKLVVMWTGNSVIPDSITNGHLNRITKKLGRKVLIWWNYPVNDTMADNLFLGPCENLKPDLYESICGLTANPMNQGYASLLPLATTADYLWNSAAYDADASLANAAKRVAPECSEALLTFADLMRASGINGNKSAFRLKPYVEAYNKGTLSAADRDQFIALLADTEAALETLSTNGAPALVNDISRWLEKALDYVRMARALLLLEKAADAAGGAGAGSGELTPEKLMETAALYINARDRQSRNSAIVSPDVLVPFISSSVNRVSALLQQLLGTDLAATGSAAVKISSNISTYETYALTNACDGDDTTFFWSQGAPTNGTYVKLDLGSVQHIDRVFLRMGSSGSPNDYIRAGTLEYSTDGKTWTRICNLSGANCEVNVDIEARYLIARCTAAQTYWMVIREFGASSNDGGNAPVITIEPKPAVSTSTSALCDGSLFTVFAPGASLMNGRTVKIAVPSNAASARLYFTALPDGDNTFSVFTEAPDGTKSAAVPISYITEVNTAGAAYLCIAFGSAPVSIAEVAFNAS